ncbi:MAG: hypothetical protein V4793_04220 [Paraburkholderia tropica]|jgi:hypothetical protein|nr:hypothetical protein [Burkholderia sp. ISTR5]
MARRPTNHARHAALSRLHKRTLLPLPQKAVDAMALVSEHERQLRVTLIGSLEKAVDRAKRFATACRGREE